MGALLVLFGTLVTIFMSLHSAMSRNEKTANKVRRVFAGITGVFNGLLKVLEPLGKYLINELVKGFEAVGKVADKTMTLLAKGLSFVGLDKYAQKVKGVHNEMKKGVKVAQRLADAEAKLEQAERKAEKTKLDYQKRAEKLRQIRDDENLTINERIKANDELGRVLKEQLNEELEIAKLALVAANLRIEAEGKTKEALDQQTEALTKISDIEERITGQESEQLTNRVSLQKEHREKQEQIRKEAQIAIINKKAKAGMTATEVEIAKEEALQKFKDQQQSNAQAQAEKHADNLIAIADNELTKHIQNNKSKLDSDKRLNDESYKARLKYYDDLEKLQLAKLEKEKEKELLNKDLTEAERKAIENKYTLQAEAITQEKNEKKKETDEQFHNDQLQAKKEKKAREFENEILEMQEQNANKYEIRKAQ
ncbi:MAG: hypothetical protein CSA94_02395, partial [Bacteroidetes bacterium]